MSTSQAPLTDQPLRWHTKHRTARLTASPAAAARATPGTGAGAGQQRVTETVPPFPQVLTGGRTTTVTFGAGAGADAPTGADAAAGGVAGLLRLTELLFLGVVVGVPTVCAAAPAATKTNASADSLRQPCVKSLIVMRTPENCLDDIEFTKGLSSERVIACGRPRARAKLGAKFCEHLADVSAEPRPRRRDDI